LGGGEGGKGREGAKARRARDGRGAKSGRARLPGGDGPQPLPRRRRWQGAPLSSTAPRLPLPPSAALKLIPHASFTFAKLWLLAAKLEIRARRLDAARRILGTAIGMAPKHKLFRSYIGGGAGGARWRSAEAQAAQS
jgi:hypothetical protein